MPERLTAEQIRALWSKTYNTEGKPDWSHLFPYYHDEIVFQDSIQRIEGIKAFLVSPSRVQIQKAWDARSIPVIIDPDAEVLKLFDRTTVVKSLFTEAVDEKAGMDILSYLKDRNGKEEDAPAPSQAAPNPASVTV